MTIHFFCLSRPVLFLFIFISTILMTDFSFANDSQQQKVTQITFELGELSILSKGQSHTFDVEVAQSFEQRARGLMFRREMPEKNGMLFLFENNQMVTMWMENTYIPLDIIFLNRKGIITHIVKSAVPESRDYIHSRVPVVSVLELNGGVTDNLNIQVGDIIEHPFFTE
ncbi:MAG: hypothetical protein COA93_03940 [Alphaproteobacteria bacterium]|nr:MAG: hypothetical protein COA93_03940 [Alphaproteobacteria bacterium]